MKQVKIKTMSLHFFKGVRNATYKFGDRTTISGPNGCGKSTIMDAFFWCLWGKNAAGRADFLVKTVDQEGQEIPNVDHTVTLELDINGETQTFERTLVPDYDKTGKLKGNHTDYIWNNVPMKKSEYDRKVNDVIDEQFFKLIASPVTFLTMPWQEQRAMLMAIAGDVDDNQVATDLDMAEEGQYHELLAKITGKTLDEYKRELDAGIRKINETMASIPPRIDEVTVGMPEPPDMEHIKAERERIEAEIQDIERTQADINHRLEQSNAERMAKLREISDLEMKRQMLINEAEAAERNAIHESNQTYLKAEAELKALVAQGKIDNEQTRIRCKNLEMAKAANTGQKEQIETGIANLRKEWYDENAMRFAGTDHLVCPITGAACGDASACTKFDADREAAVAQFEAAKQQRLADITTRGQGMSAQLKELMQTIDSQLSELDALTADLSTRSTTRDARMKELEELMQTNPKKPLIAHVDPATISGVAELTAEIEQLRSGLEPTKAPDESATAYTLRDAKDKLRRQLEQLSLEADKSKRIEAGNKRIDELQGQLRELGIEKARLEQDRMTVNEFEIARMNAVSERVNAMFMTVRFQMFQRQVNGEEVPACVCLVNGVRWQDANTAARMNAGIDVASVLANANKSFAPVFIDNAESNGNIYVPKGLPIQQIRLKFDEHATALKVENK